MKLEQVLNRFLKKQGFDCAAREDDYFFYEYSRSAICFTTKSDERMDRLFREFAVRLGLAIDCGDFLLAFFHELGHHETMDLLEEEDYIFSQDVKGTLTASDKDCEIYFNLPDEIEATLWAIDYINANEEIIKKLKKSIDKAIQLCYYNYRKKQREVNNYAD